MSFSFHRKASSKRCWSPASPSQGHPAAPAAQAASGRSPDVVLGWWTSSPEYIYIYIWYVININWLCIYESGLRIPGPTPPNGMVPQAHALGNTGHGTIHTYIPTYLHTYQHTYQHTHIPTYHHHRPQGGGPEEPYHHHRPQGGGLEEPYHHPRPQGGGPWGGGGGGLGVLGHIYWLVVLTILKNMKVNGKDYPIYYGK